MAIWIDRKQARIVQIRRDRVETAAFGGSESEELHQKQRAVGKSSHERRDRKRFFARVTDSIQGAEQILLLGPSTAKLDFARYLRKHAHAVERKIIGIETMVQPTPASALFAGGHTACVNCHRPHEFASKQAVSCRSCHANVIALAEASVPAHANCASCHEPHDVQKSPASSCKNCHWDVHSDHPERAGLGGCLTCHDAHPARSAHGQIGTGCLGCHRPHGPSGIGTPPACTTCHAIASLPGLPGLPALPGLHAKPEHQACSRCHGGHGDSPDAARNACLDCHADKRNHFPNAPRCANCHLFQTADHDLTSH